MKKFLSSLIICIALSGSLTPSFAQHQADNAGAEPGRPLQTITLKDGTILKGHLVGVTESSYIIRTTQLGEVAVRISDLLSITDGHVQPAPATNQRGQGMGYSMGGSPSVQAGFNGQINQMTQTFLADPAVQNNVQELLQDPEVMNLLQDKTVLEDAMSMDPERMQNNAHIQQLMENPKIQAMMLQMQERIMSNPR